MKFFISCENSSGRKFSSSKEEFLKELSLMIEDCWLNGATVFGVTVDSDEEVGK